MLKPLLAALAAAALAAAESGAEESCSGGALDDVAGFAANKDLFDADETKLAQILACAGQQHLFTNWAPAGKNDKHKHDFFKQVAGLDSSYPGQTACKNAPRSY